MRRYFGIALGFILALMVLPSHTQAQEGKAFEGSSYSLVPPGTWFVVSGDISEKDRMKLPAAVREHYNPRAVDAMFMDIKDLAEEKPDFKDSLNVVIINEVVPVTEELKAELSTVLEQQYESMFEGFELGATELGKIGDSPAFIISGKYSILNYKVKMVQWLVPSKSDSLVLTCTFDQSREEATLKACTDAVNTLKLK